MACCKHAILRNRARVADAPQATGRPLGPFFHFVPSTDDPKRQIMSGIRECFKYTGNASCRRYCSVFFLSSLRDISSVESSSTIYTHPHPSGWAALPPSLEPYKTPLESTSPLLPRCPNLNTFGHRCISGPVRFVKSADCTLFFLFLSVPASLASGSLSPAVRPGIKAEATKNVGKQHAQGCQVRR